MIDVHYAVLLNCLAVFNFEGGLTNVVQVTKQDYESCTAYKPFKFFNNGPANFTLLEKGVFYFISNVSNYCSLGQKISISVHECSCPFNQPPSAPTPPPSVSPLPAAVPPPYSAQVISPAPSPIGYNGSSPEAHPAVKSAASILLLHKGMTHGVFYGIVFGWVAFLFGSSI